MNRATWPIPILLALGTCAGLASALAGDGLADVPAWIGLGLPVAAAVRALHAAHR
jgi:hypothetical protein